MCSASCIKEKDIETLLVVKLDLAAELCLKVHLFHVEHSTIHAQELMTSSLTTEPIYVLIYVLSYFLASKSIQNYSQLVGPEKYC